MNTCDCCSWCTIRSLSLLMLAVWCRPELSGTDFYCLTDPPLATLFPVLFRLLLWPARFCLNQVNNIGGLITLRIWYRVACSPFELVEWKCFQMTCASLHKHYCHTYPKQVQLSVPVFGSKDDPFQSFYSSISIHHCSLGSTSSCCSQLISSR